MRLQNIYRDWILDELIEEVGSKQCQSEVAVRHAFEKPAGFAHNLKLRETKIGMSNIYFECFLE